jgi:hypothetical protein
MFIMAQAVGWEDIMLSVIKSKGIYKSQHIHTPYGTNNYYSIFFMCWIIFGGFFIQNLFVGVIISEYNRQSEVLGKNFLLTEQQKVWIETKLFLLKVKPKFVMQPPENPIRKFCFKFIQTDDEAQSDVKTSKRKLSDWFESFIMFTICVNTIILCVKWSNMSEDAIAAVDIVNYICTGIFIVEAAVKIIALGTVYFKDGWNIFDFIIVVGSLIFISPTNKKQKNTITMIRAFRVGRVLKLFSKLKML